MTGLASFFLVIPLLSSNIPVFGIYTVCVSLTIFFSYADFGFVASGQKYAAECVARADVEGEIKIIGFVSFLLFLLMLLIGVILTLFIINPSLLVKNISQKEIYLSRQLLLILLLSIPILLVQRYNAIVYSIRLEDYIPQGIDIVMNMAKIASISLFVNGANYNITGYYLTLQILSLIGSLIAVAISVKRYSFSYGYILRSFRFSKKIFEKTKSLAFSSLLLTISWILYFEIDSILLSKLYGLNVVALYAVGFSILSFCRNLYNTLYSPFQARFNHLVGINNQTALTSLLKDVLKYTFPLCIFPPLALILYMKQIILTWVGQQYLESVFIASMFVISTAILAIGIPLSYFLISLAQNKILRISAIISPLVFYALIFLLNPLMKENALALAKTVTVVCSVLITFYGTYKITGKEFLRGLYGEIFKLLILPLVLFFLMAYYIPFQMQIVPKSFHGYKSLALHVISVFLAPLALYYLQDKKVVSLIKKKLYA